MESLRRVVLLCLLNRIMFCVSKAWAAASTSIDTHWPLMGQIFDILINSISNQSTTDDIELKHHAIHPSRPESEQQQQQGEKEREMKGNQSVGTCPLVCAL